MILRNSEKSRRSQSKTRTAAFAGLLWLSTVAGVSSENKSTLSIASEGKETKDLSGKVFKTSLDYTFESNSKDGKTVRRQMTSSFVAREGQIVVLKGLGPSISNAATEVRF
jgi:hypothetical protein